MLAKLLRKRNLVVIGLNSGTSADGLDLAAIKINFTNKTPNISFISGKTVSYPDKLHDQINDAIVNDIASADELIRLDRTLGDFYGREIKKFLVSLKRKKISADLIASHGQTVRHLPGQVKIGRVKESGTLQLGHPETISRQTGLTVVADFRQADVALGGEGAPITVKAMWALFRSKKESRLMINIGGIANYFLFPKGGGENKILAADCGPGNSLLDIITNRYFKKRFDPGGKLAAKGKISRRLLSLLTADKFIIKKYGPSTGRERFGKSFAEKMIEYSLKLGLTKYDILATTAELTASAIANGVRPYLKKHKIDTVCLFGGGAKNTFLVDRLKANLPGVDFLPAKRLGYDPDYLEATCYALMGAWTIREEIVSLSQVTRARNSAPAGRIIPAVKT